jgi:actin-related protein
VQISGVVMVNIFFQSKNYYSFSFASGRSTSLILDSGASGTTTVPVHDGYALRKSIIRYEIGGETITERVLRYVEDKMKTEIKPRYSFLIKLDKDNKKMLPIEQVFLNTHPSYERFCKMEIARDLKENVVRINTDDKIEG